MKKHGTKKSTHRGSGELYVNACEPIWRILRAMNLNLARLFRHWTNVQFFHRFSLFNCKGRRSAFDAPIFFPVDLIFEFIFSVWNYISLRGAYQHWFARCGCSAFRRMCRPLPKPSCLHCTKWMVINFSMAAMVSHCPKLHFMYSKNRNNNDIRVVHAVFLFSFFRQRRIESVLTHPTGNTKN